MDRDTDQGDCRPKREASQITDFKTFHRTGGKVAAAVQKLETPEKEREKQHPPSPGDTAPTADSGTRHHKTRRALSGDSHSSHISLVTPVPKSLHTQPEEMSEVDKLREELEKQRLINEQIKTELETARLQHELDKEKMKQTEWQAARDKLEAEREKAAKEHEEHLKKLSETKAEAPPPEDKDVTIASLKAQLAELQGHKPKPDEKSLKQQQVADQLKELMDQQRKITMAAKEVAKECETNPQIQALLDKLQMQEEESKPKQPQDDQTKLMEQLLNTLQGKEVESKLDKQKEILRQFLVDSNKTSTTGGATTLKPELLKKLSGESDSFNMTEWLANRNRHQSEEVACEVNSEDCKHHKKSGMLERATTNIQQKQTWPQKNLLEDWADEDLEFKNLQFEHFVAGETRTIELATEPAQILGRLRLLRRMAYAELRGYEWPLIRKMYAAIVRSIKTKENTWENNFDRYETILYKRPPLRREDKQQNSQASTKKWFCRDWNKGNCTKSTPHKAWFGTGTNAIQRTVLHMCATCYMKDKTQKEHPENHESCPHRDA